MAVAAGGVTLLGQRLVSGRAGLAAGLLFAAFPSVSFYAEVAREYALVTALATVASYLLVRALQAATPPQADSPMPGRERGPGQPVQGRRPSDEGTGPQGQRGVPGGRPPGLARPAPWLARLRGRAGTARPGQHPQPAAHRRPRGDGRRVASVLPRARAPVRAALAGERGGGDRRGQPGGADRLRPGPPGAMDQATGPGRDHHDGGPDRPAADVLHRGGGRGDRARDQPGVRPAAAARRLAGRSVGAGRAVAVPAAGAAVRGLGDPRDPPALRVPLHRVLHPGRRAAGRHGPGRPGEEGGGLGRGRRRAGRHRGGRAARPGQRAHPDRPRLRHPPRRPGRRQPGPARRRPDEHQVLAAVVGRRRGARDGGRVPLRPGPAARHQPGTGPGAVRHAGRHVRADVRGAPAPGHGHQALGRLLVQGSLAASATARVHRLPTHCTRKAYGCACTPARMPRRGRHHGRPSAWPSARRSRGLEFCAPAKPQLSRHARWAGIPPRGRLPVRSRRRRQRASSSAAAAWRPPARSARRAGPRAA